MSNNEIGFNNLPFSSQPFIDPNGDAVPFPVSDTVGRVPEDNKGTTIDQASLFPGLFNNDFIQSSVPSNDLLGNILSNLTNFSFVAQIPTPFQLTPGTPNIFQANFPSSFLQNLPSFENYLETGSLGPLNSSFVQINELGRTSTRLPSSFRPV